MAKEIWASEDKTIESNRLFMNDSSHHQWGQDTTWGTSNSSGGTENSNSNEHSAGVPASGPNVPVNISGNNKHLPGTFADDENMSIKMAEYILEPPTNNSEVIDPGMQSQYLCDGEKISPSGGNRAGEKDAESTQVNQNGLSNGFSAVPSEQDSIDQSKMAFNRAPGVGHHHHSVDDANKTGSVIDGITLLPSLAAGQPQPTFAEFNQSIEGMPAFGTEYMSHMMPEQNMMLDYNNTLCEQQSRNLGAGQLPMISGQQAQAQQMGHPAGAGNAIGLAYPQVSQSGQQQQQQPAFFSDPYAINQMLAANPQMAMAASQYFPFASATPWMYAPGMLNAVASAPASAQPGRPTPVNQQQPGRISPSTLGPNTAEAANQQTLAALATGQLPMLPSFYEQNAAIARAAAGMNRLMPQQQQQLNMAMAMQSQAIAAAALGGGNPAAMRLLAAGQTVGQNALQIHPTQANAMFNTGTANVAYSNANQLGYPNAGNIFSNASTAASQFPPMGFSSGKLLVKATYQTF